MIKTSSLDLVPPESTDKSSRRLYHPNQQMAHLAKSRSLASQDGQELKNLYDHHLIDRDSYQAPAPD